METTTKTIAVVLGSGLLADGTPTPVTAIRAREAATLAREVKLDKLICSGFRAPDDRITGNTEAKAMADIVRAELKKPENAQMPEICLEDKSMDTLGNGVFTASLFLQMEKPGRLIVITSPFHMERALYIFGRLLTSDWKIEGRACQEWSGETRQAGAPQALERARDFFSDIAQADLGAAMDKLSRRKPYNQETKAEKPAA